MYVQSHGVYYTSPLPQSPGFYRTKPSAETSGVRREEGAWQVRPSPLVCSPLPRCRSWWAAESFYLANLMAENLFQSRARVVVAPALIYIEYLHWIPFTVYIQFTILLLFKKVRINRHVSGMNR
jgi:hypothetical protein